MVENQLSISSIEGVSSIHSSHFDFQNGLLAYTASGGVVVSTVEGDTVTSQRFFVASTSSSISTPTRNNFFEEDNKKDDYGFSINVNPIVVNGTSAAMNSVEVESVSTPLSPSKIKDKVRSINCIALSPNKKLLAVGETGYMPRILIFSLASNSIRSPVVVIYDHTFGISHLKFLNDGRYLCSLGVLNDGVINIWKASNFQLLCTNRCSSIINDIMWFEGYLITLGVRFIKIWQIEDDKKPALKGKNVILGKFLNCNFLSISPMNQDELLIVANNNRLLLLRLEESFKLIELEKPQFEFDSVLVDGKVWLLSKNSSINHLSINDLSVQEEKNPKVSDELIKLETQISRKLFKDGQNLIFLSEKGSLELFDTKSNGTSTLIRSLPKNLTGVKIYNDKVFMLNENGKVIHSGEIVIDFDVPSLDGLDNRITALGVNEEIVLGDKFGFIYVFERNNTSKYDLSFQAKAHESSVTDIVIFSVENKKYLASISRDRMIQIFIKEDLEGRQKWELLQTIPLHTANLLKIEYWNGKMYVCSSDRTISIHRVGGITSLERSLSLKASPVTMKIINDQMIVSTVDRNLSIYNLKTLEARTLRLFDDQNDSLLVENFTIYNSTIFTSSPDKSLRSFNFDNGKLLTTNFGHLDSIVYLEADDNHLMTIGSDGCVFQWNLAKITPSNKLKTSPSTESNDIPSPLYAKVQRKIIPTSPIRDRNSWDREVQERRESPSSPRKIASPSPSPRLTTATLKRMERSRSSSPTRSPVARPISARLSSPESKKTLLPPLSSTLPRGNTLGKSIPQARDFGSIREQVSTLKSSIIKTNLQDEEKQIIIDDLLLVMKDLGFQDNKELLREYSDKLLDLFQSKCRVGND